MNEAMRQYHQFAYNCQIDHIRNTFRPIWKNVNIPKAERRGKTGREIQDLRFTRWMEMQGVHI